MACSNVDCFTFCQSYVLQWVKHGSAKSISFGTYQKGTHVRCLSLRGTHFEELFAIFEVDYCEQTFAIPFNSCDIRLLNHNEAVLTWERPAAVLPDTFFVADGILGTNVQGITI